MSGSVNKAIICGNLGRDPEIRSTQSGDRIANLSVATSEAWKDRNSGERRERTEWHRVVVFNDKLAEVCEKYLKKGSKVYVEGQIQTRKWTDQSGQDRYSTEIVLQKFEGELQILSEQRKQDDRPYDQREQPEKKPSAPPPPPQPDLDDEIPF